MKEKFVTSYNNDGNVNNKKSKRKESKIIKKK